MERVKFGPASQDVVDLTKKIITQFPDKFLNINIDDIHFIFKDAEKSKVRAYVKLLPKDVRTLTNKKILLAVWKQDWESSKLNQQAFVIYHELTHIVFDEEKNKYVLRDHDIKDFRENLKLFGLDAENVDSVFGKEEAGASATPNADTKVTTS